MNPEILYMIFEEDSRAGERKSRLCVGRQDVTVSLVENSHGGTSEKLTTSSSQLNL